MHHRELVAKYFDADDLRLVLLHPCKELFLNPFVSQVASNSYVEASPDESMVACFFRETRQ